MRRNRIGRFVPASLLAAALLTPSLVFAHADIVERLTALDRQIEQAPADAELHRKRGELHRLHRDWPAAQADYDRADRLDPGNSTHLFYRGRMWWEAGDPARARPLLDSYLAQRPNHADARLTRSRVLVHLNQPLAAADDLTRAIELFNPPTPEVYLDRARALVSAGPPHIDRALQGLDEGTARLGPLVTLIQYAIEVERLRGKHQVALQRLDKLPEPIARQPAWLGLRGDILRDMGEVQQAQANYRAGLDTIETYPPARRNVRATVALESRLRASLQ